MRTIIDIPDPQVEVLNQLAKKQNTSRAEIIRQALNIFIFNSENTNAQYKSAFGSWKDIGSCEGISFQQHLRDEWTK